VTPPPPFTGEAELDHTGAEQSWSGDLAVAFPGISPVALTGPEFTASLERSTVFGFARALGRAVAQLAR
jgi:hypothetical protein